VPKLITKLLGTLHRTQVTALG